MPRVELVRTQHTCSRIAALCHGWRRLLLGACVAFVTISAFAQNAPSPLRFKTTQGGRDAKNDIRDFIQTVQRDMHDSLGLPYPREGSPEVVVEIGFARPFALTSCHRVVRYKSGQCGAVIMIPDPDTPDWSRLRYDVVAGIFRSELHNRATRGAKVTEPPEWFIGGIANALDSSRRMRDFEQTYNHWSHASLDCASALLAANSRAKTLPCVAAQIVAWCADRIDRADCWERLLDSLAAGEPWSAVTVSRAFGATGNAVLLDSAFDEWLHARARHIFIPGTTSAGAITRFRLILSVFAEETPLEMRPFFDGKAVIPLSLYVKNPDLPGARKLLVERAGRARSMALGRDRDFAMMCSLYADALETASKDGWFGASAKWLAAEESRSSLEARAAAGEVIGESESKR